jgi:hypothetical protein
MMSPGDALLLAEDWLFAIEAAHAETDDPEERAALEREYDEALEVLAKAGRMAERQRIATKLPAYIEATLRPESAKPVPTGPGSPIWRGMIRERLRAQGRLERHAEGHRLLTKWGLLDG